MPHGIRPFAASDPEEVSACQRLISECVPHEEITASSFAQRVLNDPNFSENGTLVAEARLSDSRLHTLDS